MTMNRRDFIATAGVSAFAGGAVAVASPGGAVAAAAATGTAAASSAASLSDWATVKSQFDLLSPEWLHFSQFYIVSHPKPVRAAIERYRQMLDSNPFVTVEHGMGFDTYLGHEGGEEPFATRVQRAAAEYIGGQPDEIALTDSTTQGLALIYNGLTLRPGDEVLATTHDHYVHHESIRLAVERSGASWRRIPLYDDSSAPDTQQMVERLRKAIAPGTRVVSLTWVHSSSGVRLPIRTLAQVVTDANRGRDEHNRIILVLDAVHGFGNQAEALSELGCDFAAAGTHKWIFAPRGTGILSAPKKNWPMIRPTIPTFYALDPFAAWADEHPPEQDRTQAAWVSPGGFKAFEHQWAMGDAFEFHERIGRKRIADRIAALKTMCKDGLSGIKGVQVLTPRDPALSAGLIAFEVQGQTANDTVRKLLAHKVIGSTTPYKISRPRLAPSLVNDEREVEAALRAVRAVV
jgi:selenocysteine lyase/cysteine desulfurase